MVQRAQFVDLTRSYLPIDPVSLTETLATAAYENSPEKSVPVMAYEGHNFMPTASGYRSYFGLSANVNLLPLGVDCDYVFVYQRQDYTNFFVALCADGIYTNQGTAAEAWTHVIVEGVTSTEEAYLAWSYCVIGTSLFMYRQGDTQYHRIQVDAATVAAIDYAAYAVTPITPTHLNMSGQMGIFKAGGRLGFWDSDNAVSWSAFEDLTDFVPAIKTQANVTKFVDVVGRITTIKQHGDGFIIYATKSVVHVSKDLSNTFLWTTSVISTNAGVAYAKQVVVANPDTVHFAWLSSSFVQITTGKSEIIGTELFDYLQESTEPVLLHLLQGRYLFLDMLDSVFFAGNVSVSSYSFPSTTRVLTDYVAARHILIDGAIIPGTSWTVPGYPGVAGMAGVPDVAEQLEVAGFPAIPGVDTVPAITDKLVAETWNTLRDSTKLGPLASLWYQQQGKVWPEYPTGHIDTFSPMTTNGPIFITPSTSNSYVLGDFSSGPMPNKLYNNFNYIPNIPFALNAILALCVPDSLVGTPDPTKNTVEGFEGGSFAVTPPEDLFGKALLAWEKERVWMKECIAGLKKRVYEHQPVTDIVGESIAPNTSVVAWNSTATDYVVIVPDLFYPGEDLGQNITDTVATFYIPTGVHPEEYFLKDSVYHMFQEVAYYEKHELTRTIRYSKATAISYWDASLGTSGTIAQVLAAYDVASPGYAPHTVGNPIMIGSGPGYAKDIKNNDDSVTNSLFVRGVYNREVSYSWNTTQIYTPPCKLQYHAWIPPVWKAYDNTQTIVSIDPQPAVTNPAYYCNLIPHTKPLIGSGGFPILPLQSPAGPYAGGIRYIPGSDAITGYGGFAAINGKTIHYTIAGINPILGIPGGGSRYGGLSELVIDGITYSYPAIAEEVLTFPGGSFLLQAGSPSPAYPTFLGAFVYDLQYKRWGKQKGNYKQLMEFTPINTLSAHLIPYSSFGVEGATLGEDGLIHLFDANPSDSFIKYGKIGITRLGETSLEEVQAQFRLSSTGTLNVESSLDGKSISSLLSWTVSFTDAKYVEWKKGLVGKWHNITLSGQYDVVYLEYRSFNAGRR